MSQLSTSTLEVVSMYLKDVNDEWQKKMCDAIKRLENGFLDENTWKAPNEELDIKDHHAHSAAQN